MAKKRKDDAGTEPADTPAKGRGRGSMVLPALLVTLGLLGGGAFAGGLLGGGSDAEAAAPAPTPTAQLTPLGAITELEAVTAILADGAYAQVGLAVEFAADVSEELPTAPVLDRLIALLGTKTADDLDTSEEREATKSQLLERLGELYGEDVVALYYTEFVMQAPLG